MIMRRTILILLVSVLLIGQAPSQPSALQPNSGAPGAVLEVSVLGGALSAQGQIYFEPRNALQPVNPRNARDGSLQFTLQVLPTAPPRAYDFIHTNDRGAQTRIPNAFTVIAPPAAPVAPSIRSITPATIVAGDPPAVVQVAGSGFKPGAQLLISGSGVTATVTSVAVNGDGLTASVAAVPQSAAGGRTLTVRNPDGLASSEPVQLQIQAPRVEEPRLTSITPSGVTAGTSVPVMITGSGIQQGAQLQLSGSGAELTVSSVSPPSQISAMLTSAATAPAGPRIVRVTNPDGTSNAQQSPPLQVEIRAAPPPVISPPVIRFIGPDVLQIGAPPSNLQITGSNFRPGATLQIDGVQASVTSISPNGESMTAMVSAAAGVPPGPRPVRVTNTDGTSNAPQLPAVQLTLEAQPVEEPRILSITPSSFTSGDQNVDVIVTGSGFQPGASVQISGAGVTFVVGQLTPGRLTGRLSSQPGLPPGPRNLLLTNPDGTSTARQLPPAQIELVQRRDESPVVTSITPDVMTIGLPAVQVEIRGRNFKPGLVLDLTGIDAVVASVIPDGTSIRAILTPRAGAVEGIRPVMVTNPDGTSNRAQQPQVHLTLNRGVEDPRILSINPSVFNSGDQNVAVALTGSGFQPGATVQISGAGVTFVVQQVTAGRVTGLLSSQPSLPPGPRNLLLTNPDGTSTARQSPPPQIELLQPREDPPVVTSITPDRMDAGAPPLDVVITGARFKPGARVSIDGVDATAVTVIPDGTSIRARLSLLPAVQSGARPVVVINPDGGSNAAQPRPVNFTVVAPQPPEVTSITPDRMPLGSAPVDVVITGLRFKPGARVSIDGIDAGAVTVVPDGTSIRARLSLLPAVQSGARPVVVVNPDGASSSAQPRPVMFTVVAPDPPEISSITPSRFQQGASRVPVTISGRGFLPGATFTPSGAGVSVGDVNVTSPTSAVGFVSIRPDAAAGERLLRITNTDGSSNERQPSPPRITIEARAPEALVGPRVDRVTPSELKPGERYTLSLQGKNLALGTTISFGPAVTIVGVPHFLTPESATVEVIVGATASGSIAAVASNQAGSNSGPGGVLVTAPTVVSKPPSPPPATTPSVPPPPALLFKQPETEIILDSPCDPDAQKSSKCTTPVTVHDGTHFVWHELNPGVSKFFIFEIVDSGGNVLVSAQTNQPYYRLTAANLAALPRIESKTMMIGMDEPPLPKSGAGSTGGTVRAGTPTTATGSSQRSGVQVGALSKETIATVAHGDTAALTQLMAMSGPNAIKSGAAKLAVTNRQRSPGEVYWRVRGVANEVEPLTGKKLDTTFECAVSAERAILLPLPPNGFACDLGTTGSHLGPMYAQFFKSKFTYQTPPKPCTDGSSNVCSLSHYAIFGPDARLDLTRVPFDLQQIGDLNSSSEVTFQNVFIDWGDGSEPKPLTVKGKLASGSQSLKSLRLVRPKNDNSDERIKHMYLNKDKDAEYVTYRIRIFSVANVDKTPAHQVAIVTAGESTSTGSMVAAQGGAVQTSSTATGSGLATSSSAASASTTTLASMLAPTTFTIACTEVKVWNPWGVGADEPLHLLSADLIFPTDGSQERAIVSTSRQGRTVQAPSTPLPPGTSATNGPVPEISDCSSAFKAAVKLNYWGSGKVRLRWYVDDVQIETTEHPGMLPPVSTADGKSGKKPWVITMDSALPAALEGQPHRIRVIAEAIHPDNQLLKPGMIAPITLGQTQQNTLLAPAVFKAGTRTTTTPVAAPGGSLPGGVGVASGVLVTVPLEKYEPGKRVESPPRFYAVFDHKERGLPCIIRYATAETGSFEISDILTLQRAQGGSYSGSGMLKLHLPSHDGLALHPIKVSFSGWTLEGSSDDEDVMDVVAGTLQQTYAAGVPFTVLNLPMKVTKVSLTPQRLAIDGDVGINNGMGFTNATVAELPRWEFTATNISSEGDFHFESSKKVTTELGSSQFILQVEKAEVDLSRSAGGSPVQPCSTAVSGPEWVGIRISGKLQSPETLQFNKTKLLGDYSFDGWGIGPAGLSLKLNDAAYSKSLSTGGVILKADGFQMNVCNGSFGPVSFGLEVTNAPLVVQTIKGKISLDQFASTHASFPNILVKNDWGDVRGEITHAAFGYSSDVGEHALTLKSHFWFKVRGKPAFDHAYNGVIVTLSGKVFGPGGKSYFSLPAAQTAKIAGYPMAVTALGVGNSATNDLWFGFRGDLEVGEHAPAANDREAQFLLTKKSAAMHRTGEPLYQLASLDAAGFSDAGDYQEFGYSSSTSGGVTVQEVHLDFAFPPGTKTVTVVADCLWEESSTGFYFVGDGTVTVAESLAIGIAALYGRTSGEKSYWMVKASVKFPTMIPLGSTGVGLAAVHGGLGLSVPISAYDMQDIRMVKSDNSGNYSFSAGVDIGTLDEFLLYARGTLTVKMGGPDAGVRVSVGAWLMTTDHTGNPLAEACFQYAGGAFDAGMAMHLETAGGLLSITAPKSGPDTCTQSAISIHFGGSKSWHIYFGQKSLPLTAKLIVINGKGYLMIDGKGIQMYNGITINEGWKGTIAGFDAYVSIKGGVEMEGAIKYSPFFIKGSLAGYINLAAGADVAFGCCHVQLICELGFSAEAPPVKVCGKVRVFISMPPLVPDIDVNVGPVCVGG
jgi:hypothetical protein